MLICISGTPGTGKSSVGRAVSKLTGLKLIEANDFARANKLVIGHDKRRKSLIIDTKGLKEASSRLKGDHLLAGQMPL